MFRNPDHKELTQLHISRNLHDMKEIGDFVQYAVVASQGTKLLQRYSTLNIICLQQWLLNHSATLRTTPE